MTTSPSKTSDFSRPPPLSPSFAARLRSRLLNSASVLCNSLSPRPRDDGFGILMYHRFADQPAGYPPLTWNVTPRRFDEQLSGLLSRGFEVWPLRKVLEYYQRGERVPRNVFVITCDDGYANFLSAALPVLQKHRVSATLFLPTAYLDTNEPFPFDDWPASGQADVPTEIWMPIKTDEVRQLIASGCVEIGAHTHTHQDFRSRPDVFEVDLRENVAQLKDRFGITNPSFAFPYGPPRLGFTSEELVERARAVGVVTSLTTERIVVRPKEDPFHWGRFTAEGNDTAATLAARLNGWNDYLRDCAGGLKVLASRARGRWRK